MFLVPLSTTLDARRLIAARINVGARLMIGDPMIKSEHLKNAHSILESVWQSPAELLSDGYRRHKVQVVQFEVWPLGFGS